MNNRWNTTAIVGAGTIGLGWAALFAANGATVRITDPRPDLATHVRDSLPAIAESIPGITADELLHRIHLADSPADAVADADLVQESGPEDLGFKQRLFAELAEHAPETAVFASSSSAIVASDIAAQLPENVAARLLIAHPFNPPQVVPLVEIVPGARTTEEVTEAATEFYRRLGKTPVVIGKEVRGFVANRLQSAVLREAFSLVIDGVVSVEELDTIMRASLGGRWATVGPFESYHLGGGPGGIRHMIEHLGRGLSEGWKHLGTPELTEDAVSALIDQTEQTYGSGSESYFERSRSRDRKHLALTDALTRAS